MNRVEVATGALVWVGATLLLSGWGRAARPSLVDRLRPFGPGAGNSGGAGGVLSVESMRDVLAPLARAGGDRLAALFGVFEPVALRLRRVHSPLDASAFRLRQVGFSGACLLGGALLAVGLALPGLVAVLVTFAAPTLAFLVIEQRLARESERWQRTVAYEAPVISEQLATLLNAGYSLGSALTRLAERGQGCVALDLGVAVNRVRQGLSEADALREWAEQARVEAVDRLVSVLTLHSEAADLGRLVSAEARQSRRDLHRRTIEAIERRSQQVWVPVTVATLVPGVILLAVPFLSALRLFSNA